MIVKRSLVMTLLMAVSLTASAGTKITGVGPTPEIACWNYEYRANREADKDNTCYASCKPAKVTFDGKNYKYVASVPNHEGSCGASKYNRSPVSSERFRSKYPYPGSRPSTAGNATPTGGPPKAGINTVTWLKGVPDPDRARLIVENRTKERGVTYYRVSVRDTRYSFPARVIDQGEIILEPNTAWVKEFHQWSAAEWKAETR